MATGVLNMSLPLGHLALGATVYDLCSSDRQSMFRNWRPALLVTILANLPDIDMIFGLILRDEGGAFHRGATHSILFALLAAFASANAWRMWPRLPRIGFFLGFAIILSHLLADYFLTSAPVSFLWPLNVYSVPAIGGWGQVVHVAVQVYHDLGLIMVCGAVILCRRLVAADYLSPGLLTSLFRSGT